MSEQNGSENAGAKDNKKESTQDTAAAGKQSAIHPKRKRSSGRKRNRGRSGGLRTRRRCGWLLPFLILLVFLVACAGVLGAAWDWFYDTPQTQRLHSQVGPLHHRLSQQSHTMKRYKKTLGKVKNLSSTQKQLKKQAQSQASELNELDKRLHNTQKGLGKLKDVVQGGRELWLLDEVEELLLTANDSLDLRNDVSGSLRALRIAGERLSRLNDPRLLGVRKKLSGEITDLQTVPELDISGMAITLSSLSSRVHKLPLRKQLPKNYHGGGQNASQNGGQHNAGKQGAGQQGSKKQSGNNQGGNGGGQASNQPWWSHLGASVKNGLKGLVSVRHVNNPFHPMLPPKQAYFLYQNLALKLEAARLALLQRQNKVFHDSLDTALNWLNAYFKSDDSGVKAMQQKLKKMQKKDLQPELPNIGGSLDALRKEIHSISNARRKEFKPAKPAPPSNGSAGESGQ